MNSGIDKFMDEIEQSTPQDIESSSSSTPLPQQSEPIITPASTSTSTSIHRNRSERKSRTFPMPSYASSSQGRLSGIPEILGRVGSVRNRFRRDGHHGPGKDPNNGEPAGDSSVSRQSPVQDINSAMIEANQEIRQLREQQTQEAMTDRVKRLSKSAESNSDKDRFLRGMGSNLPISSIPEHNIAAESKSVIPLPALSFDQGVHMKSDSSPTFSHTSSPMDQNTQPRPASTPQDDLVRLIAQRVSQQLRDAQQRGEAMTDYHSLIAREIVREQRAGVLPISPADSRKNSAHAIDHEELAQLKKRRS